MKNTFDNIEVRLNGIVIDTIAIPYKKPVITKSQLIGTKTQNIHFNSKQDLLQALKNIGVKLQFDVKAVVISYTWTNPDFYPSDEPAMRRFISTVTQKEWKELE